MTTTVLTDALVCAGPLRLSERARSVMLTVEAAELDSTVLASGGWASVVGGLDKATVDAAGFYSAAAVEPGALPLDLTLFQAVGGAQTVVTVAETQADGAPCYIVRSRQGSLAMFGAAGDLAPFDASWTSDAPVGRGQLLHPPTVTRTASGTGTGRQIGAIPAGRHMVCALHVVTVTGTTPSLTVVVQSDDNSGFTSPTTRATFTAATAAQYQIATVAAAATDNWWRITWTITGTTPVFRFVAALGIA